MARDGRLKARWTIMSALAIVLAQPLLAADTPADQSIRAAISD